MRLTLRGCLITWLKTYLRKPAIIGLTTLSLKGSLQPIIAPFWQKGSLTLTVNLIIAS